MAMAEVNGVRLHYQQLSCERTHGEVEDVVLIHGLAANLAFWYLQIGHALARNYRVTMYDLRGHGRSSMPQQGYTPAEQAEDLRQLLDHLGIGRAHFIAHSFGGTIALNLACEQPQRFRSLTIADTHIAAIRNVGADWRYADQQLEYAQGAEMGRFLLGSTVVMLFPKGALQKFNPAWAPSPNASEIVRAAVWILGPRTDCSSASE